MRVDQVLVVIPCWNEAPHLASVLGELRRERPADRLVVVDDASSDESGRVARQAGCDVVGLPVHLGYGGALQAGIRFGMRGGHPVVVTFDADGQHDPVTIAPLVRAVSDGADLVLGARPRAPGSFHGTGFRRLGRRLFALAVRGLTGLPLSDPTSGLKALGPRGQALFALSRFPDRYPDADALVLASRAGLRVEERPAAMRPSRNPRSMHDGLRGIGYGFNMALSLVVAALGRHEDLGA